MGHFLERSFSFEKLLVDSSELLVLKKCIKKAKDNKSVMKV